MKRDNSLSLGKILLCGMLVALGCFIADTINQKIEPDPENMSVEELNGLLNQCIAKDTSEGYLQAVAIRDLINLKTIKDG
jgi:hypothetical protein